MTKQRYGRRSTSSSSLRWLSIGVFSITAIWLLSSIITQKSPLEVLSGAFSKLPNPIAENREATIITQDSLIQDLQSQLDDCKGKARYKRGIVIIDNETLNLRSEPSLVSSVVMRIPANSEVEVMFYDTKTYYLKGKAGKWVKIRYAEQEGWAWGNFIQEF